MPRKPVDKNRLRRDLVRELKRRKKVLGKERDALRSLLEEYKALEDSADRAYLALDDAVSYLSEYV